MKKNRKKLAARILMAAGVMMILAAVLLVTVSTVRQKNAKAAAEDILSRIERVIPEPRASSPDDRIDMSMPSLSIDGEDFAAIVEVPKYGTKLPVYSAWSKVKAEELPCRYTGSMYDGSLIIGGVDAEGQLDFMGVVSAGDHVSVTDMTGERYSYKVSDIIISSDVSTEKLVSLDADLVLFARKGYSGEYTVVCCKH